MRTRTFARTTALATTVVATAALLSGVVATTGAYFTDSKPGAVAANFGDVAVAVAGENINFANVMPGEVQTQTVTVQNTGTGNEDIWLAFDNTNKAWSAVNDLGQYGKFVIGTAWGDKTYDNLSNQEGFSTTGVPGAPIAGSFMKWSCSTVNRVPSNYLPSKILLATLTPGQVWAFNISFNIIACKSDGGGSSLWSSVADDFVPLLTGPLPLGFSIAAFQPGVSPNDPFNGTGAIPDLTLPIANYAKGVEQ
jgi:hypothetical protein